MVSKQFVVACTIFTFTTGLTFFADTYAHARTKFSQNSHEKTVVSADSSNVFLIAQASSSIVGQYLWQNGDTITVYADGSLKSARGDRGRWQKTGGNSYRFNWNSGWVDSLVLSPNGASLSGNNLEPGTGKTFPVSATKSSLAGIFDWSNGDTMTVYADGSLRSARGDRGRWQKTGGNSYRFNWNSGWVDSLVLSSDGASLSGNNLEPGTGKTFPVSATRRQ